MKTVEKAMDIVAVLVDAEAPLGVTEIADICGINKSTVHKILAVLCRYGYAAKSPYNAKYTAGNIFIQVGGAMLHRMEIRMASLPYLQTLCNETKMQAAIVVRMENRGVYVGMVNPTRTQHPLVPNLDEPLWDTIPGRAILASLLYPPEFPQLEKEALDTLKGEIDQIRKLGYACGQDKIGYQIAAAVRDRRGDVAGALSVICQEEPIGDLLKEIAALVMENAEKVSNLFRPVSDGGCA